MAPFNNTIITVLRITHINNKYLYEELNASVFEIKKKTLNSGGEEMTKGHLKEWCGQKKINWNLLILMLFELFILLIFFS